MFQTDRLDSRLAVIADVGRSALRLGVTDDVGKLREETIRCYDPVQQPTVSGAIMAFGREAGLALLPKRLAVAVSGAPRGDTITVTNGRWRISRSGLTAMLQQAPLILNDFAANAWALSDLKTAAEVGKIAGRDIELGAPGTYCVIGVGSGLGVALLSRNEYGSVRIIATEAGHSCFPTGLAEANEAVAALSHRHGFASAEMILSRTGLATLYSLVGKTVGTGARPLDASEIIRNATQARDPAAIATLTTFGMAFWHFVANVVLMHGAWDGVIVTGGFADTIRSFLQRPEVAATFELRGPFQRQLATVPRAIASSSHAELRGAALALLAEDAQRSFQQHGQHR